MLSSEGWPYLLKLVDEMHGSDATLREIERIVGAVALGDQLAVNDAAQHVLSGNKAARGVVSLPAERIAYLTGQKLFKKTFDKLRRA
jgi:hypothetical protein